MLNQAINSLKLYYSIYSAPCRTVLLTLKCLDLDLPPESMRHVCIYKKFEQFEPWYEQINYEKIVPTIVDNGFVLWESRAIAKYLVQKHAKSEKRSLYPSDIREQALVDRILYFDQGVLNQSICDYFKPQYDSKSPPNPILGAEIDRSLQLLEKIINGKNFVLGGTGGDDLLTIADLSILATLSKLESMNYSYDRYEIVSKYVEYLKDHIASYRECCQDGINQMKKWNRKNFKYVESHIYHGTPNERII
ncbi:hypothetical protein PPYR_10428 [Photinus pyralis]|uniref:GST N-terminal domain-containing protein n=2 Tax=Photinus pyralis TaxID=7054 RepID=A0A5N4AGC4_PHOPY|nr:glutathione S-transferase 4-like [Photinus pyralis]KAB0796367.1 hypothetical protein PPYR_10428 [Photinus pyralis]